MLKSSFAAIYGCLIGLVGLTLLMTSAIIAPGCTGVLSARPCDYVALAKQGASQFGGHSRRDGFEVLDRGSSVYVHQPLPAGWLDGPPGVLTSSILRKAAYWLRLLPSTQGNAKARSLRREGRRGAKAKTFSHREKEGPAP